jgi:hypothetical protein
MLSADNAYSDGTTLKAGTLDLTASSAAGRVPSARVRGARFQLFSGNTTVTMALHEMMTVPLHDVTRITVPTWSLCHTPASHRDGRQVPSVITRQPNRISGFSKEFAMPAAIATLETVRRIAGATALLTVLSASAAYADTYHFKDVLKPHGHQRGKPAMLADARPCGATGTSFSGDLRKFEQCMRAHGWVVDRYTPDTKTRVAASNKSSTYIDPDTGLSCRNVGGIAICVPPHGTVRYFDPEQGLNCQRTGIVAICSNF